MSNPNLEKYIFSFVSSEVFFPIFRELRPKVFVENNDVDYSAYWTKEEQTKFNELQAKCRTEVRSYLLCKDDDKIVGWSFGYQKDAEEFYMVNSAVLPEYRMRGVYNHLLELMIEKARKDGFQIISSNHHASNNAILIPKLKFGFKITGMRLHPRFGTLLDLQYFTNEKVGSVLDYRTGYSKNISM